MTRGRLGLALRSILALVTTTAIAAVLLQRADLPPTPAERSVLASGAGATGPVLPVLRPVTRQRSAPTPQHGRASPPITLPSPTAPAPQVIEPAPALSLFPDVRGHIVFVGPDHNLRFITGQHAWKRLTGQGTSVAPALSPDGSGLAWVELLRNYSDILVARLAYGHDGAVRAYPATRLTQDERPPTAPPGYDPRYAWYALKPSWLPDGRHLVYLTDRPGFDPANPVKTDLAVWEQGITDTMTQAVQLSTPTLGTGGADSPVWRPHDPAVFLYVNYYSDLSLPAGEGVIEATMAMTMTQPTAAPIGLTPHGTIAYHPAWSPDGHLIAFAEHQSDGRTDLKVMPFHRPGTLNDYLMHAVMVERGHPYVAQPFWSPDGRYLGYLASTSANGGFELYIRSVTQDRKGLRFGAPIHIVQAETVSADYRPTWGEE